MVDEYSGSGNDRGASGAARAASGPAALLAVVFAAGLVSCEPLFVDTTSPPMPERIERASNIGDAFESGDRGDFALVASRFAGEGGFAEDAVTVFGPGDGGLRSAVSFAAPSLSPVEIEMTDSLKQVMTMPDGSLRSIPDIEETVWLVGESSDGGAAFFGFTSGLDETPELLVEEVEVDGFSPGAGLPGDNDEQIALGGEADEGVLDVVIAGASAPSPAALTEGDEDEYFDDSVVSLTLFVRPNGDGPGRVIVTRFPPSLLADLDALSSGALLDEASSVAFEEDYLASVGFENAESVFFARDAAVALTHDDRLVRVPFPEEAGVSERVGIDSDYAVSDEIPLRNPRDYLFSVSPDGSRVYFYAPETSVLYSARPFW